MTQRIGFVYKDMRVKIYNRAAPHWKSPTLTSKWMNLSEMYEKTQSSLYELKNRTFCQLPYFPSLDKYGRHPSDHCCLLAAAVLLWTNVHKRSKMYMEYQEYYYVKNYYPKFSSIIPRSFGIV